MKNNYTKQAIALLDKIIYNERKILLKVMADNPHAFIQAVKAVFPEPKTWQEQCQPLIELKFIEAVKLCRSLTGMTLIDAKNACDQLRYRC